VKEIEGDHIKPSDFSLSQNYPNPFNPVTNFQFTLPKSSHVKIEIFNIVGQKVATLVDGDMKPGLYTADWNGRDESGRTVSSGIYFYRMQAGDFSDMKKMVLVK
jgi:flagellar hook assembly protein FlgD